MSAFRLMKKTRDLGRTILLCLIGGSADAIAYLRFGTFVGAMSGNTILLGIDAAEGKPDRAIFHAGIIAAFLLAVIVTRGAMLSKIPPQLLLVLTAVMLGGSPLIAGEWSAAISAAALGIQNAAVRKIGGVSINTVFVTGDLVRLGSAVPQASVPDKQNQITLLATAWIAYAAGAMGGAVALHLTSYPMALPALLALLAALIES
jgi:uncharacterized membrane protein YoaK (UPF0700 family)